LSQHLKISYTAKNSIKFRSILVVNLLFPLGGAGAFRLRTGDVLGGSGWALTGVVEEIILT